MRMSNKAQVRAISGQGCEDGRKAALFPIQRTRLGRGSGSRECFGGSPQLLSDCAAFESTPPSYSSFPTHPRFNFASTTHLIRLECVCRRAHSAPLQSLIRSGRSGTQWCTIRFRVALRVGMPWRPNRPSISKGSPDPHDINFLDRGFLRPRLTLLLLAIRLL